jgi:small subunit ribosomal protein S16
MVKLRLTRLGRKQAPVYRIVAMEALSRRDGKAIAYLGNYYPLENSKVELKEEEILTLYLHKSKAFECSGTCNCRIVITRSTAPR